MEYIVPNLRKPVARTRKSSLTTRNISAPEQTHDKDDTLGSLGTNGQDFKAVVISPQTSPETHSFVPLSTVLRAHIPLVWLSGDLHSNQIHPGTLVRASILSVSRWEYQVLVARLVSDNKLYALERVEVDIYVCHPLRDCVKSHWIDQATFGAAPILNADVLLKSEHHSGHGRKSSTSALVHATSAVHTPASPKLPHNRRGKLARLSILESREKTEDLPGEDHSQTGQASHESVIEDQAQTTTESPSAAHPVVWSISDLASGPNIPDECTDITTTEIDAPSEPAKPCVDQLSTEHLRKQYFETLYLSKTSLAFYAKGPLSRARARARVSDASRSSEQLAEFYKECILSTKKMDIKYTVSISQKVKLVPLNESMNANDEQSVSVPRKTRRTKLGKDALWPMEDEYIARWWRGQAESSTSVRGVDALDKELRGAIAQLHMRETEMHIIMIMEILALEEKDIPLQRKSLVTEDPDIKVESIEKNKLDDLPKKKAKRTRDMKSELDFLVERICIRHSLDREDSASTSAEERRGNAASTTKDRLKDFCKDVILPFYGGKLPDLCRAVCNRMGGPEVLPRKSKSSSEKDSSRQISRTLSAQKAASNKRPLQRVSGEEGGIHLTPPPVLARSSTLPISTNLKRETSERPISRCSLQKSVSFSNREVDLVADARVTAAKRRKLDLVTAQKRELDAAIENLKRPNRSMVAKNFMDDIEQRRTADDKTGTKRVAPIQISATPKRGQAKQISVEEYDLPPIPIGGLSHEQSVIPSSTNKPRGLGRPPNVSRSSATKRAVLSAIHDTPSRNSIKEKIVDSVPDDDRHNAHIVLSRASSSTLVTSTPTTSRLKPEAGDGVAATPIQIHKPRGQILFTPVKRSEVRMENVFKDVPEIPEQAGRMMDRVMGSKTSAAGMSIYESLGWEDDYDL